MTRRCCTIEINGTVQGVGFRPFVYRAALKHGITGSVRNTARGVIILACGKSQSLDAFAAELQTGTPPLARIASFQHEESDAAPPGNFTIETSQSGDNPSIEVACDTATCDDCIRELFDPADRRYRHPFINCTQCGPRYSIIRTLPYDRIATTMADFEMCPACAAEYHNPLDRRFHAQPVCCPRCGPRLSLVSPSGQVISASEPLQEAVRLLASGAIVAVKGVGGFHLACRADREAPVALLRKRKHRPWKPLAVMVRDIAAAEALCHIGERERALLASAERPIALLRRRAESRPLAENIAPGVRTYGIMLPYTPIHHLLFDTGEYRALIMTSGNISGEPICSSNDEALSALGAYADAFLLHDRPIHIRIDDPVVRIASLGPVLFRRARGFVPAPISAEADVDGIIAFGGIEKNTITIGRGRTCYVSQYLGNAQSTTTAGFAIEAVRHFQQILGVTPALGVFDSHPSSSYRASASIPGLALERVQHHHAHAAACMAENHIDGPALCLVFDGAGMGDDGAIWGGEFLVARRSGFERAGHLAEMAMPGGDLAARFPGRMALGALFAVCGDQAAALLPWMDAGEIDATLTLLRTQTNCARTTSMGRLFDAMAAILDICRERTYEGQPAIELEASADASETASYGIDVRWNNGRALADGARLLQTAAADFLRGTSREVVAARFHNAIIETTARVAAAIARDRGIETVCFSGGCFQNMLLLERLVPAVENAGLRPAIHRMLPPGDECVSYGQAIVAAARRSERASNIVTATTEEACV